MHKMAEEAPKIRLVRCPKCGNVLQEPQNYPVYLCGGCDAVLRAKKISSPSDDVLEKSNEEDNVDGHKKLETLSENLSSRLDSLSEVERERDGVELSRRKDRVPVDENVHLVGVSSTRTKNIEILIGHDDLNARVNSKGLRFDQGKVDREVKFGDKRRQSSKQPIDEWIGGDDHDLNLNRSKSVRSSVVRGIGGISISSRLKNSSEVMGSRVALDRWGVEREGFWGFDEDRRTVPEHHRFSPSAYHDEGPSNHNPNSFYGYGEPKKNLGYPHHEPFRVENLEQDRAEILRKLNDLKEQISRLDEKPRGTTRPEPSRGDVPAQPFEVNHASRPPNLIHSRGPASFKNDRNLDMHKFYPPPRHSGSLYKEPFWSQQLRRPATQPPTHYKQQQHRDYYLGRSVDFDQDLLSSRSQETFLHQPACSCLHCYNKNSQIPPKVSDRNSRNRRLANYPTRSNFYHNVNPMSVGRQNYHSSGVSPLPLHSQEFQPFTRWPTDIDSDVDGFRQGRTRRVVVAHGKKKFYRPVAGGAPFITCFKCFELLKLPRKLIKTANDQKKLQCGACSTVYSFEIKDKRLIISVPTATEHMSVGNGAVLSSHNCSNVGGTNSVDFDHSGFNFQSVDTKPNSLLENRILNLTESEKRQGHISSSSVSSEEEKSPDSVIVQRGISNCAELPSKDDMSPSVAGSPFNDHFNGSSSINAVNSIGKGNKSKRTDQEKVILNKIAAGKDSNKDASVEIEGEVSFSEYVNTSLSENSVHVSREEDQPRIKTGLVKKSVRDFSRSNQSMENVRSNVSVNGQPVPDHLVKKAEKLAGPIHPGNYWYDFRAGFWGVMGQPCCGIISPFIEEFNYSMPENCAAGSTGVFVNGRELHQTDFDLLVSKGLPNLRNKNYIVEISGRVVDEDTGEELDSLGKLAPTVEKVRRGFGMRVPKVAL
ncbi:hypothetical protein Ddye_002818 [Dipteronia dyeriana]|uniref:Zinc-ribbon domain-containing protein n=1 Tax=Dipteronia dyeriana TaxID=168575 RepID=A0AAD9XR45_9ROSI|nr:hypothetical protein Ddye_002818 [Dipteronia dyeriana]